MNAYSRVSSQGCKATAFIVEAPQCCATFCGDVSRVSWLFHRPREASGKTRNQKQNSLCRVTVDLLERDDVTVEV